MGIQGVGTALSLFATAAVIASTDGGWVAAESQGLELKPFVSKSGGYEVSVPAAWHTKELPGAQLYQGFHSREGVEKAGDLFTFGVSITRLRDYHAAYKFESRKPADMALEYANRIAGQIGKGKPGVVVSLPASLPGMDAYAFMIVAGEKDDCLSMHLVLGIHGKEWFQALWEIPCSEAQDKKTTGLILKMARSLKVDRAWGQDGG